MRIKLRFQIVQLDLDHGRFVLQGLIITIEVMVNEVEECPEEKQYSIKKGLS